VTAVNSLLQRARGRLRQQLPVRKPDWPAGVEPSTAERDLLKRYIDACESDDIRAFESLICQDAVFRMPPEPGETVGRDTMLKIWSECGFGSGGFGRLRCVSTRANRQPAVAAYVLRPGDTSWRALALDLLRIEEGRICEVVTFAPDVFPSFGLPLAMDAREEAGRTH
jgi:RNA polymerase sigma-70 factor (ECF subfamily)